MSVWIWRKIMIADHAYRPNIFTADECTEIRQLMESNINVTLRDMPSKDATKTATVGMVEYGNVKSKLEKFINLSLDANKHLFGFDLFHITDMERINYNVYETGSEYTWHIDAARGESRDFKLTALLNVSEAPFEGGVLELFNTGPWTVEQFSAPGSFFIFPSWIPHRVTPVTSGTRTSITLFLQGPTFK